MDKITKAISMLGINASDIKDISQTTNLETTELYLQDTSVVKIKNNRGINVIMSWLYENIF